MTQSYHNNSLDESQFSINFTSLKDEIPNISEEIENKVLVKNNISTEDYLN